MIAAARRELVLELVRFGDVLPIETGQFLASTPTHPADADAPHVEHYFVIHRCEHATVAYYCASCRQLLANLGQLAMHVEAGGTHRLAVWCGHQCRVYQEPSADDLAAFRSLA